MHSFLCFCFRLSSCSTVLIYINFIVLTIHLWWIINTWTIFKTNMIDTNYFVLSLSSIYILEKTPIQDISVILKAKCDQKAGNWLTVQFNKELLKKALKEKSITVIRRWDEKRILCHFAWNNVQIIIDSQACLKTCTQCLQRGPRRSFEVRQNGGPYSRGWNFRGVLCCHYSWNCGHCGVLNIQCISPQQKVSTHYILLFWNTVFSKT